MKKIKTIFLIILILFSSCKKSKPNFPLPTDKAVQIKSGGNEISFFVPKSYNSNTGDYLLAEGSIVFSPQSCINNETLYSEDYMVGSGTIPNVLINNNQKGVVYFNCSTNILLKDALVKFPFENVSMFNAIQKYKPYRIKIDNISNMLIDLNDASRWEELPIIKIDSVKRQVHFYSREFQSYVYCVAKR
jgi:hypothetical protein